MTWVSTVCSQSSHRSCSGLTGRAIVVAFAARPTESPGDVSVPWQVVSSSNDTVAVLVVDIMDEVVDEAVLEALTGCHRARLDFDVSLPTPESLRSTSADPFRAWK